MSDLIDDANDAADLFLQSALHEHKQKVLSDIPNGIGICLECGAEVEGERRWCDSECRDYWEEEQNR